MNCRNRKLGEKWKLPETNYSNFLKGNPGQMKTDYPKFVNSSLIFLILIWTISCSSKSGKNAAPANENQTAPAELAPVIKIVLPEENSGFKLNEPVKLELQLESEDIPDSVVISFGSRYVTTLSSDPWDYTIPPDYTASTGRKSLKVTSYKSGKAPFSNTRFIVVYSDVKPENYGYRIVNTYPHDREAFTQGLFYYKGVLYEGTGQETGSSLREVEIESGKVLRQHNLEASLFGEGITLFNDRIYQVTWQNRVGFVYDRSTFKLLNKLHYSTEGWGLTTVGNKIVMSDGSNVLYFMDPEMFTVVSSVEVYDNKTMIDSLNELEYINGEIWANIWMTDKIARIDPESGKVNGYIHLDGLLNKSDRRTNTDVLNGIAYDEAGNRIFVTGKLWPKLFEIRLVK
jgi:glutamine cyclotransferase